MKLLLMILLLNTVVIAQGEITSVDHILKEQQDIVRLGNHSFYYSIHSYFEKDFKRSKRAQAHRDFTHTCEKIGEKLNKDFQSIIGLSKTRRYVRTSIRSIDHGKYKRQFLCYVNADVRAHRKGLRQVSLSYFSTPIFSGKTGDEKVLQDCTDMKFALRKKQTNRVAIHDRIETIRTRRGPADKKIYKCQVMWASVEVKDIAPPVCRTGDVSTKSIKASVVVNTEEMLFPYHQDIVPVRPLGYYDSIANNKHIGKKGSQGVSFSKIVEEKQIPFTFKTSSLNEDHKQYKITGVHFKGNFIKSLKKVGNNPRFNNTELLCVSKSSNICSGRHFRNDWAKYMEVEFWSNTRIANTLFSDKVSHAYRSKAKKSNNEFVEVDIDFDVTSMWGKSSFNHFQRAAIKKENINFILTDDMWAIPNSVELEFEYTCR